MEHTKKMVLVPQESLQVTQNLSPSVQTPGDPVTRLDAEMSNVLMSDEKDDREKWNQFQQFFSRFLQTIHPKPVVKTVDQNQQQQMEEIQAESETFSTIPKISDEKIIDSVPQPYQKVAKKFVQELSLLPDNKFRWDKSGRVYINDNVIPNSSISDLLNDVVRKRKNFLAVGRKPFAQFLKDQSVPKRYIGNQDFWDPSTINETLKEVRANKEKNKETVEANLDNIPLVNRLRKQARTEKRRSESLIQLPYDKSKAKTNIKIPWSYMRLRERKSKAKTKKDK